MLKFLDFLTEAKETFEEFAKTRGKGAEKIAENAQSKGGLAMLTYNHFKVKAPYDDTPEIIYVAIDYKYYDLCIFNFNVPVPLITRCHSCFGINMG